MDFKYKPNTKFKSIDTLNKKQAAEEISALREGINYHDYLYYVKNSPKISDAVYDKLFQRLDALEAAFPHLKTADSPTARVGAEPVSKLDKIEHKAPLLSLEATLEQDDIESFLKAVRKTIHRKSIKYMVEPKFDGLSVEVVYGHGHFEYGATRGNGEVGEDISHNLKTIRALPLALQHLDKTPALLAVRGEVFMSKKGFTALNKQRVERGDEPFANPRNAAAGLMRQFESRHVANKHLDIFFYEVLAIEGDFPSTHQDVLERLSYLGLKGCPLNKSASTLKQIENYHHKLAEQRDTIDYEIDGIVIKIDDHALREALGTRERTPRWALAWKFEPREEVTIVEDIVVQVGRTGILTPVALLQPVDVGGVTVSRATLHNEDEVHRKDIRRGDRVRIIRAGDVIPEVKKRVSHPGKKRSTPFHMPKHCPVCDAKVVREGAYYLCTAGLSCAAQLTGRIQHYAARNAMDINHLGERSAAQLVTHGLVHDLADLYTLDVKDIERLEGFATKSAKQLHDSIQELKDPRLDRFLFALGIRHVGRHTARVLASEFRTLDRLIGAETQDIARIPRIGEEIAVSVTHFFSDKKNRSVLNRLQKAGLRIQPMPKQREDHLTGKTFVFTGSLEGFTRDDAKEQVEARGAQTTSSVSDKTDFIVVGKKPGKKLAEAEKHGVKRINEETFRDILEES